MRIYIGHSSKPRALGPIFSAGGKKCEDGEWRKTVGFLDEKSGKHITLAIDDIELATMLVSWELMLFDRRKHMIKTPALIKAERQLERALQSREDELDGLAKSFVKLPLKKARRADKRQNPSARKAHKATHKAKRAR